MSNVNDNVNDNIDTRLTGAKPRVFASGTEKKLLSLLGFAARARRLVSGADLCRDAIRRGTVLVAIVAADASANTKKRIGDACSYYGSEFCQTTLGSAELSKQIGKTGSTAVVGITDVNFANGIKALFDK